MRQQKRLKLLVHGLLIYLAIFVTIGLEIIAGIIFEIISANVSLDWNVSLLY